jgi:putative adhesin
MKIPWKTAVLTLAVLLTAGSAQAAEFKEIHQTIPLDRDGRVSIDNFKGSITVKTGDEPEVRMGVRIEPDGMATDPNEQKKVGLTDVRVSGSGSSVSIRTSYDRLKHRSLLGIFGFGRGNLPLVHYTLQVPATARLDIKDYKSSIQVTDLRGDLRLKTYKGKAEIEHLDGAADIETYKGEVRVEFARFAHASRLNTYKGEFEVRLPKDSRFDLDADTGRRGDLDSDFSFVTASSRRHWGSRGSVSGEVNGGGPALKFTTYKGNLRLRSS